jgi:hypothetical protein
MRPTDERRSANGLERFFKKEVAETKYRPKTSEEWWAYICSVADARRRKMGFYPMAVYAGSSKN